jgi:uncharacterized protein (UPF0548 family)
MMSIPWFGKPSREALRRYIARQQRLAPSYKEVGATASQPPAGYRVDHTRICLGRGPEAFAAARQGLEQWQQFRLGWLQPAEPAAEIRQGEVAVLLARLLGVWWLNACRIVYVVDDEQPRPRFGFAYGTLAGHVGRGEERFLVEMDEQGQVWYDILAFSRPATMLAHVGYPYMRRVQKQFGRDSAAQMRRVVRVALPTAEIPPVVG